MFSELKRPFEKDSIAKIVEGIQKNLSTGEKGSFLRLEEISNPGIQCSHVTICVSGFLSELSDGLSGWK